MSDSSEHNKIDVGRKIMQWLEEESAIFQEEKDPYRRSLSSKRHADIYNN